MKYLLRKDLIIFFNSAIGYIVISVWLLALSMMLWLFKGEYNLPDRGYANLLPFFSLAPILLTLFVPAITMRLFAEEKRSGTLELLFFRPYSVLKVVLSKFLVSCLVMSLALLLTLIYIFSIHAMSTAGVDIGEVAGGYLGLICVMLVFSAIGLFTSSLTSNQLVSFILGILICFFFFFGFNLLASLYSSGHLHNAIADFGMHAHYQSMVRGVIDSRDLIYFISIVSFFLILTVWVNSRNKNRKLLIKETAGLAVIVLINILSVFVFFRIDMTEGKRYTLSPESKEVVTTLDQPLKIISYLNGELNPAFDRLRNATIDLLEEISQFSKENIILINNNPAIAPDESVRQQNYLLMEEKGMKGVAVNERDREGRTSSKVVFPWLEIIYKGDTIPVNLLKRNINLSPQENLNSSIEEIEYKLTEAIRLLQINKPARIAFIEGHGEWNEPYVYEATKLLSKYYHVDRGMISGDPAELLPYRVLIIASPQTSFTEAEKYALDQYLMNGGSLFFLIDGIQISEEQFNSTGESVTLKKDVNLDDLLFVYGVRINPVTIQDMNCTFIRLATSQTGAQDAHITVPWYFSPLTEPVNNHIISRNISPLKSEYVSTINWVGGKELSKTVLMTTSANAHTLPVPEKVSLRYVEMPAEPSYFNESYLPVVGLIEGKFTSVFNNRMIPEGVILHEDMPRLNESKPARVIVAASGSFIKNEWRGQGRQSVPLPLGYDPITGEQLGNSDFIVNAVNYLAGNEKWLNLKAHSYPLRLLNKQETTTNLLQWQLINILLPQFLLFIVGAVIIITRKKKYSR